MVLKEKFPGLNNMTVDEVRVMAAVCKKDGCTAEEILETVTCVDDCLTVLKSAAMINCRRGNSRRRVTAIEVIEARIMNAKI